MSTDSLVQLERSSGVGKISFRRSPERTRLDELHQQGCCKIRLPRPEPGAPLDAVLINTAGGLTDGDRFSVRATWHAGTRARVTTQAAERVYRSRAEVARIDTRLDVGPDAQADWLPQETILFDGGRLARTTTIDLVDNASLFATEAMIFGRTAMGERVERGFVRDGWELRHDGETVFVDRLQLGDDEFGSFRELLERPALADGAVAYATMMIAGPECGDVLEPVREVLGRHDCIAGATRLDRLVLVRVLARQGDVIRQVTRAVYNTVRGNDLPPVWNY